MEDNKTITELNKRKLNKEELEQVTGGGTVRTPNVGDRDINYFTGEDFYTGGETYRGSQTTMPLTQGYTPIV